jgi:hypothetical protein
MGVNSSGGEIGDDGDAGRRRTVEGGKLGGGIGQTHAPRDQRRKVDLPALDEVQRLG